MVDIKRSIQLQQSLKIENFHTLKKDAFIPIIYQQRQCSIIANVLFGSPKMNCAGHGICKISQVEEECLGKSSWSPCRTIAQVIKHLNGHYLIQILKSTVSSCLYKRQFDQPYFQVDADFDMSSVFQSTKSSMIKKGSYIFWQDQDFIYIDFSGQINQYQ